VAAQGKETDLEPLKREYERVATRLAELRNA
jgi:hypothetical protein